ncbi:MAG: DNA-processing protein DprA [Gammaproteobacteria bacterium]|nr:DNA-processing protein DprA [Gammaproteobacteria bacterium]MYB37588.1 DNA-processing protein DprA [Gammaproteobacteria bacterium]
MEVTPETEAVMLLTVALGKSGTAATRPLTPTEWGEFANWLNQQGLGPADMLHSRPADLLQDWKHPKVTEGRVRALLNRGASLGFALEKWERAGLWAVTRSDADYPIRLKHHLQRMAPAVLFGCGNKSLLNASGIAVVGSRHAEDSDIAYAERIGSQAAQCGQLVVSGGAAGVDHAAMFGALNAEGTAIGVLAEGLLRAATSKRYRSYLMSGDLALVSPFNPEARFVVGNAMARNKYIYCLAHEAVVVSSTPDSGGTWKGAVENLKKRWVPLAVKRTETVDSGNPRLVELGGRWLEGFDDPAFGNAWGGKTGAGPVRDRNAVAEPPGEQAALAVGRDQVVDAPKRSPSTEDPATKANRAFEKRPESRADPAEELFVKVRHLVATVCAEPTLPVVIADTLGVTKPTADAWIKRLVAERVLKKLTKPVRYAICDKELWG